MTHRANGKTTSLAMIAALVMVRFRRDEEGGTGFLVSPPPQPLFLRNAKQNGASPGSPHDLSMTHATKIPVAKSQAPVSNRTN